MRTKSTASRRTSKSARSKTSAGSDATFTKASARKAAKAAKEAFAKATRLPDSWKPGGKDYARVLGHFGARQG